MYQSGITGIKRHVEIQPRDDKWPDPDNIDISFFLNRVTLADGLCLCVNKNLHLHFDLQTAWLVHVL